MTVKTIVTFVWVDGDKDDTSNSGWPPGNNISSIKRAIEVWNEDAKKDNTGTIEEISKEEYLASEVINS